MCNKCKKTKPAAAFHKNRAKPDGLQSQCKVCKKETDRIHHSENALEQQARNRALRAAAWKFVAEIKEASPCMDCGVSYPHYVMDFDHVRGSKVRDLSTMCSRGTSKDKLMEEIAKCDLVCANCHRIRTFTRRVYS